MKFIVSGVSAACFEFLIFLLLDHAMGATLLIYSQSISFIAGFIISFILNRNWVFQSKSKLAPDLAKYLTLLVINLILTNLILSVMVNQIHIVEWVAKLFIMGMVAVWNYLIIQKLIFKNN